MEFVFRRLPADGSPEVQEHELWLIPEAEGMRRRRDLARLAFEAGPEAFLRGSGNIREIYVQHDPTLDDMLAAFVVERRLSGVDVPPGVAAFCEYAKIAREGRRPGTVPIEVSLEGIHAALRNLAGADLGDDLSGSEFVRQWRGLAERVFAAAQEGVDPFQVSIVADDPAFASPRSYLQDQKKVYRQDVENGERWIVRLPGGPPKASGLMLRQPKSLLWKHWARADEEAPLGGSYLFTAVCGEDGNWIFSTDPVHRQPIKGLAEVLQLAELQAAGDEAKSDPWFDGKPFGHTLVAPPKRGSKLSSKEVLRIARQWARVRKAPPPGKGNAQLQWGMALAVVVAIAVSLSALLRQNGDAKPGPMEQAAKTIDDGVFDISSADPTLMRLFVLSIGVSQYADESMELPYADEDAVELNDAFVAYTGALFMEMNRSAGKETTLDEVVSRRLIAEVDRPDARAPTRQEILEGLIWLETGDGEDSPPPTPNDLAIVTISGHGQLDAEKDYYLLASGHRRGEDLRLNGVTFKHEIAKTLNRLKCTVIVILDTCHAGASAEHELESGSPQPTEVTFRGSTDVDEFQHIAERAMEGFQSNPRGVLLLPACTSDELAAESRDWKHGALSLAVLEALRGEILIPNKAAMECLPRKDIVVFADVVYYANNRVFELTNDEQLVTVKPSNTSVRDRLIPLANRQSVIVGMRPETSTGLSQHQ